MERKGKWFLAVKKAFSVESKKNRSHRLTTQCEPDRCTDLNSCVSESLEESKASQNDAFPSSPPGIPAPPSLPKEELKDAEREEEQSKHAVSVPPAITVADEEEEQKSKHAVSVPPATTVAAEEEEQSKHALSVPPATTVAAEEEAQSKHALTVVAAQASAEIACFTNSSQFSACKSREDVAVVKIQTAFRAYKARRALQGLRGMVRLKSLMEGSAVKRQTANTLHSMQTLAKVQSQIHSRRIRMLEEIRAFQKQLQLKHEKETKKLKMGEKWDDSAQSKQQLEAHIMNKQKAATRRERAMAYAFSHQWRSSTRSVEQPMFMNPANPHWGWSWLERWTVARPWESQRNTDTNLNNEHASVKIANRSVGGETVDAYARSHTSSPMSQKSSCPPIRQSHSMPPSRTQSAKGKTKSVSPRGTPPEDDMRGMRNLQSERRRRHSLAGLSLRDDESLVSSPSVAIHIEPTKAVKANSQSQCVSNDKVGVPERSPVNSAKKRLSFPVAEKNTVPSPTHARRHSGPVKVDISFLKEVAIHSHNSRTGGSR